MYEMNEKHKNHMSKSNNCVSQAVGRKQQDFTMIQKTKEDEDCNSTDILSKVIMLEKEARKTSNFVLRDDVSKNEQGLNVKLLNSLRQDVKWEDGEFKNKRQDRLRQSFAKTFNFVSRDDVKMFTYTDYFFASEDAIVWVKSLLMQRRLEKFRDTKSLISRFNMRAFPLLLEKSLNFWKQDKTSVMTYC